MDISSLLHRKKPHFCRHSKYYSSKEKKSNNLITDSLCLKLVTFPKDQKSCTCVTLRHSSISFLSIIILSTVDPKFISPSK